jgi:hypothetical protein
MILPPDMELFLTDYLRGVLADRGESVRVTNVEPSFTGSNPVELPLSKPIIVIRDDSGPMREIVTFDRSIGVTVLAGSKADMQAANNLARLAFGVMTDRAIIDVEDSPIASIEDTNGPYAASDDLDVARRYFTVDYIVVGSLS